MIDSNYMGLVGGMLASDSPWICAKQVGINKKIRIKVNCDCRIIYLFL